MNLKRKAALSLLWCTIRSGIEQGASFIIFLILGRMLMPDDFGLVALAAAFIDAVRAVSYIGLFEGIIGAPEFDDEMADTAFWISLGVGLLLACALVLLAGPIAQAFQQPKLEDVTRVMSLIVVVSCLGIVHTGRLARDFGHKALAMRALAANVAGGVAAIAVIFAGGGLWALVAQRLAAETMQTIAAWMALPWMPRFRLSLASVHRMAAFGVGITIANLVNSQNTRAQEAVSGLYLPVGDIGALRIANRLFDLVQQMVFLPANQVSMVTFSKMSADRDTLREGLLHGVRLSSLVAFPGFLGLAALAPDLVPWMFGHQWLPSVPLLQVLCLAVAPTTLLYFLPPVQVAIGRAAAYAGFCIFYLLLGVGITIFAARYGIIGVAFGLTARCWVMVPLALILLKRGTGVGAGAIGLAVMPPFLAALAAGVPALALSHWLGGSWPAPLLVVVEGVVYVLVYAALMLTTGRSILAEAAALLLPMMPAGLRGHLQRILPTPLKDAA